MRGMHRHKRREADALRLLGLVFLGAILGIAEPERATPSEPRAAKQDPEPRSRSFTAVLDTGHGSLRVVCTAGKFEMTITGAQGQAAWARTVDAPAPPLSEPQLRRISLRGVGDSFHVRVPLQGGGAWEGVIDAEGKEPVLIWEGRTGFQGPLTELEGQALRVEDLTGKGVMSVVVGAIRKDAALCGMDPPLLSPKAYDPQQGTFLPVRLNRLKTAPEPVVPLTASRKAPFTLRAPLMAAALPKAVSSSAEFGEELVETAPPAALSDRNPSTWWTEGVSGFGEGEFVILSALPWSYPIKALAMVLSPALKPGEAKKLGRVRRAEILTGKTSYSVEIPEDPADHPGEATWIVFPSPIESPCLSLVITEVYPGRARPNQTAIADLEVFTTLDFEEKPIGKALADLADPATKGRALSALESLARTHGPEMLDLLPSLETAQRTAMLEALFAMDPAKVAKEIVDALLVRNPDLEKLAEAGVRKAPDQVLPFLADALKSEDAGRRERASAILAGLGTAAAATILAEAIGAAPADVGFLRILRRDLGKCLSAMKGGESLAVLKGLSYRDQPERRLYLIEAVPPEIPELAAWIRDEWKALFRQGAGFAFRYRLARVASQWPEGNSACCTDELLEMSRDMSDILRAVAVETLSRDPGKVTASDLERLLKDSSPRVRDASTSLLARMPECGGNVLLDALRVAARTDPWPFIRVQALQGLGACLGGRAVRDGVLALGDASLAVRQAAVELLSAHAGEESLAALAAAMTDPREAPELRGQVALVLGKACYVKAEKGVEDLVFDALKERWGQGQDEVGEAGVAALGMLGTAEGREVLEIAVRRGPPLIQKAALSALKRLLGCQTQIDPAEKTY